MKRTAAAEAMTLAKRSAKSKSPVFLVAGDCHPQTIEVVRTRAEPLGIDVRVGVLPELMTEGEYFGVLAQYPSTGGLVHDLRSLAEVAHAKNALFIAAVDVLALTLLESARPLGPRRWTRQPERRHRHRQHPALWRALRLRWAACGFPCLQGRLQTFDAGPLDRCLGRCARQQRVPAHAANPRTTHPAREGHLQHLYRAGAARRHCEHVRGLSRSRRPQAHRAARASPDRDPRQRPGACRLARDAELFRHPGGARQCRASARRRARACGGAGRRHQPAQLRWA